jgi:hypothetical protein
MVFISAEQAAALKGTTVHLAVLVEMQFLSKTVRLWTGDGRIEVAGEIWDGAGAGASIEGLDGLRDTDSNAVTFGLSGVDPSILSIALGERTDVAKQPVYVWAQLFQPDMSLIGARIPLWWGRMQRMRIKSEGATDDQGELRQIFLEAENPWLSRSRPENGNYSDAEQNRRSPGDKFCRFTGRQRDKPLTWPNW